MAFSFGRRSRTELATCDDRLVFLAHEGIKVMDFTVYEGHREKWRQDELHNKGFSKAPWPYSLHNDMPSKAFDLLVYPIRYHDHREEIQNRYSEDQRLLGRLILYIAKENNIPLRWGGDWNMNGIPDENWFDLAHFELLD